MSLRSCCAVWILLAGVAAAAVFVEEHKANTVLRRWRRANSGYLEELQQGNLERECIEEKCDYEEAREVFEDEVTTREFWKDYNRRGPCKDNPCHNNGRCVEMETSYKCNCPEGFVGQDCDIMVEDSLKCLYQNGGCEHFCDGSGESRKCSCAYGYQLGADGEKCIAQEDFACGRLVPKETGLNQTSSGLTRLVGANLCREGECPWQVLVQLHGENHCGGVLISPYWVVTAAHCVHGKSFRHLTVAAGENDLDVYKRSGERIPVSTINVHQSYVPETGDSDIALLRLVRPVILNRNTVPICLPTKDFAKRELLLVRYHTVSGWGKRTEGDNEEHGVMPSAPASPLLRKFDVPIIPNSQCSQISQFNFTNNMLCAGYLQGNQQSCRGDDGSPLVTRYGSTYFLTGVVGWGRGCPQPGFYGVYTNMANFVDWAKSVMTSENQMPTEDPIDTLLDMLEQRSGHF